MVNKFVVVTQFKKLSLLSFGRMYQRCSSVFEAASLRLFRMGRTEGIRSTSSASAAFVKAFDDPRKQVILKQTLI